MEHKSKKVIKDQQYDNYWKLTVEYTDIFDTRFNNTLRVIVDYIDEHVNQEYSSEMYKGLQDRLFSLYEKADYASTRKSINQFIKLGFVYPKLKGYHNKCKRFINESDNDKKKGIFSEIFYEHASFSSSVIHDYSNQNEVKFLLKTLAYHPYKKLSVDDVKALMVTPNFANIRKGYLTIEELAEQKRYADLIKFDEKKYNQISYIFNFLNNVDNIQADKTKGISFINPEDVRIDSQRDPIRYSIFKTELKKESKRIFGNEVCYVDEKNYLGLTASHIKDSSVCLNEGNIEDAYNYENGLLLSQQNDMYFDHYYISFKDDGSIIINENIFQDNKEYMDYLKSRKLNPQLLTPERKNFLNWHRKKCLERINN